MILFNIFFLSKFSLCSFIIILSLVHCVWPLLWTQYLVEWLSPFLLVLFPSFFFLLLFGTYSSPSSFWLSVRFYVLGRSVECPSLGVVTLYRRCLLGPKLAWSLEPATLGMALVWAACAFLLWLVWLVETHWCVHLFPGVAVYEVLPELLLGWLPTHLAERSGHNYFGLISVQDWPPREGHLRGPLVHNKGPTRYVKLQKRTWGVGSLGSSNPQGNSWVMWILLA